MENRSKRLNILTQAVDQDTPKSNPIHHAEKLARLPKEPLFLMATGAVKEVKPTMDDLRLELLY